MILNAVSLDGVAAVVVGVVLAGLALAAETITLTYADGKKIGWRDGVRALACIVAYSRAGEAKEDFLNRCDAAAEEKADAEAAKLRDKYERRFTTLRNQLASAERRADPSGKRSLRWIRCPASRRSG